MPGVEEKHTGFPQIFTFIFQHVYFQVRLTDIFVYISARVFLGETHGSFCLYFSTCIFCNDKNEQYTEEGLDLHYWKNCPMLKRCSFCKQVRQPTV